MSIRASYVNARHLVWICQLLLDLNACEICVLFVHVSYCLYKQQMFLHRAVNILVCMKSTYVDAYNILTTSVILL